MRGSIRQRPGRHGWHPSGRSATIGDRRRLGRRVSFTGSTCGLRATRQDCCSLSARRRRDQRAKARALQRPPGCRSTACGATRSAATDRRCCADRTCRQTPNLPIASRRRASRWRTRTRTAPGTLPSRQLLVGQPTLVHQVETDMHARRALPDDRRDLRDAGYRTAGVFSGPYVEPYWGFGRGFDRYRAAYGDAVAAASHQLADLVRPDHNRGRPRQSRRRGPCAGLGGAEYEAVQLSHADVGSSASPALNARGPRRARHVAGTGSRSSTTSTCTTTTCRPRRGTRGSTPTTGAITGRGFFDNPAIAESDPP